MFFLSEPLTRNFFHVLLGSEDEPAKFFQRKTGDHTPSDRTNFVFFGFFPPHLFPADVRGQARQPVLGGRHTARASWGLPAVIRQEFG